MIILATILDASSAFSPAGTNDLRKPNIEHIAIKSGSGYNEIIIGTKVKIIRRLTLKKMKSAKVATVY